MKTYEATEAAYKNGYKKGYEDGGQNVDRAYEMEMLFTVSVGLRQINDIMAQMGFDEKLQIQDAVTVSVKQVLPVIPDEGYIQSVAKTIKDTYKTEEFTCTACNFKGYKYLREIKIKDGERCFVKK